MPSFERTDLGENTFRLKVSLQPEDYYPKFEEELKRFRKTTAIKGFRKGQAPMSYLRKMYGKDVYPRLVIEELSNHLDSYVREQKIQIVGQPLASEEMPSEVNFDHSKKDQEQTFYYEIGYVDDFEIKGLDGSLTIEQYSANDLDDLAEKELDDMRRRTGTRSNPTDGIEDRDLLTIASVEVDAENAPIEGGWATDITIYVDSIKDEAFKAEILKSKTDDIIFFNARKVENFEKEHMYRKYFLSIPDGDDREVGDLFRGEITNVNRLDPAELNEEFFKANFGEDVDSKEAAIEKLKPALDYYYKNQTHHVLRRRARSALIEANPIALPTKMLRRWLKAIKPATTDEQIDAVEETMHEDLRWSLMQNKMMEQFDVFVSDDELENMAMAQLRSYFQGQAVPEDIMAPMVNRMLQDKKSRDELEGQVESNKLYMALIDKMTIQEITMPSTDLQAKIEELSEEAKALNAKSEALSALLS